jgi:replicative DNA helicase
MEDGNLRLYVLKILLQKKNFLRVKKIIHKDFFSNGVRDIYNAICQIYEDNPQLEQITFEDLRISFFETYFANQSVNAQLNIKNIISRLEQSAPMSDTIVENAIKSMYKMAKADEMSKLCIELGNNPSKHSFQEIRRFLNEVDEENFEDKEDTLVSTDFDEILSVNEHNGEFEFNIHELQNSTGGIGRGNFMVVFARPETGKTAFWVSLVAKQNGFAWQGHNCHSFINEEPAKRTQMRMINACSDITRREVYNGSRKLAEEQWNKIKSRIFTHDKVGMTMEDLDIYCKDNEVDILIIDQLDKVNVTGKFNSSHEKLRDIYLQARELAKRHNCLVIGMSQASAEGHGKLNLSFNVMENSKTGKAAEADLIVGIGKNDTDEENVNEGNTRTISISKNKLSGTHPVFQLHLIPALSQYKSII